MAQLLSEQKTLRELGIKDFGQLNKEKSIRFASMLHKMEPEVAKKALEQFPEFSRTSRDILSEYKDTLDKGMASNDASIKSVYENYNAIILSLQKELENDNLSFEEKVYILEQMKDIASRIDKKDTENKKWIRGMVTIGGVIALGGIALLAMALGGDTSVKLSEPESPEPEPDDKFIDV